MASNAELIAQVYIGFYDRAPDPIGLQYWVGRLEAGVSIQDIGDSFAASPEASETYPYFRFPDLLSQNDFLAQVYMNVFGRAIDPDGLDYYSARMTAGESAGSVVASILGNASTNEGSPDQAYLQNKVDAGLHWSMEAATTNADIYQENGRLTDGASDASHGVLDGITADPTTVDAANEATDAYFGGGGVGETFTLTTGIDNIHGTDGQDVISGAANGNFAPALSGSTFNTGDVIDGGAGNDVLRVVTTANTLVVPTLSNVETIDGQIFGATLGVNLASSTGVETLSVSNGNGGMQALNVGNLVDVELNNTTGGGIGVVYSAATVAGTADVQNVAVNSAIGVVQVNGIETVDITSTGAAATVEENQLTLVAAGLKTLNIDGDGHLHIMNAVANTVTTVDASASTGGVEVRLGNTSDVTATGGSGDDTFAFGSSLTAADVVDGGDGFDAVGVNNAGNLSAAADIAVFNGLTSIEHLLFNGGGNTTLNGVTFTNAAVTNVQFNTTGVGADAFNNIGSAITAEFGTNNSGAADFALVAGSTELNLAMMGTDGLVGANDGNDADVDGLTIVTSGANSTTTPVTVNLTSNGDLNEHNTYQDNDFNDTGAITVASGSTVNVDGDGNLAIFGGNAGAVQYGFSGNVTLDTSALTGNTVLAGSDVAGTTGSPTVPGPEAVQALTNTGVDAFTLGSGHDTIVFTTGNASGIIETSGVAGSVVETGNIFHDVVTGFTAGTDGDMLFFGTDLANAVAADDYTAIATATQTTIDGLSGGGATLLAAADLAAGAATAGDWTAFSFQGSTYALLNGGGDGAAFDNGDVLVQLVGVNVADLTDANFAI